jgi:tagaturonate reductase
MSLPRLSRSVLASASLPRDLSRPNYDARDLPVRVLQIGEGVFLRAFVDPILHALNQSGRFNGGVVVAQPRAGGHAKKLNEQDGLYTVLLRGRLGGDVVQRREIVGCIREGLDPYTQHDRWLELARDRNVRFVFSNTTEAGIAISNDDRSDATPALSFPAKMTQFLRARFEHFEGAASAGVVFIPCELIENNGTTLKSLILQTAKNWNYDAACVAWIENHCVFANTLVDRIVTGHPGTEAESIENTLGYRDTHLNAAEPYMAWVIEVPAHVRAELPLDTVAANVTWADDVAPYRERKVRLLNGAHTMLTPISLLLGIETVREAIEDARVEAFVKRGLFTEIIPTIDQPRESCERFAGDVLERFSNPFIAHKLTSIALNSVAKFKARLLPAMIESTQATGRAPACIALAAAALITLYRTRADVSDDAAAIEAAKSGDLFASHWPVPQPVRDVIRKAVNDWLSVIESDGIEQAIAQAT